MLISKKLSRVAFILAAVVLPQCSANTITYLVTADTSAILAESGFLDLQLEPGPTPTNDVTATVTSFTTNGTLTGAAALTGDVTGQLPSQLSFDNQTVFNDYFQGMTFGAKESFDVTLTSPVPVGGGPSAFNIAFYASDASTPLLTTSPDGNAGQIVIDGDGVTTPATYSVLAGQPSALTITLVQPVATAPEASQLSLIGLGLLALGMLRRKPLTRA